MGVVGCNSITGYTLRGRAGVQREGRMREIRRAIVSFRLQIS